MGNSLGTEKRKRVVIVGGGFGGIMAAKDLDKDFDVVLIDRKNYFFFTFGSIRACLDQLIAEQVLVPYGKLLENGVFLQASVETVKEKEKCVCVRMLDGNSSTIVEGDEVKKEEENFQEIKYDYLIISTGVSYSFPSRVPETKAEKALTRFQETLKVVSESKNVAIIGGGAVGIELAGEIAEMFKEVKVTLIHSKEQLMYGNLPTGFKEELKRQLLLFPNIELVMNDRVVIDEEMNFSNSTYLKRTKSIKTEQGKEIDADLVFYCGGGKVNNASFSHFTGKIDSDGRLKVNQFLQVEGEDHIFAIGDCANVKETKRGASARLQAKHACKNIRILSRHENPSEASLTPYKPKPAGAAITIGRHGGAIQPPLEVVFYIGKTMTGIIKGSGPLGALSLWRFMNQSVPSQFEQDLYNQHQNSISLSNVENKVGMNKDIVMSLSDYLSSVSFTDIQVDKQFT